MVRYIYSTKIQKQLMITSIFKKSKTINFITVFFITLLAFVIANLNGINETLNIVFVVKKLLVLFALFASMLLLSFIVNKNNLTNKSHLEMLFLSLFLLLITETISKVETIITLSLSK